ncbi:MAG TPA: gliding motility-associated C-terminal domain-containing protein [Bacteroidia bacterium]|nr:gliding motility-associated C-terminal domain-containing protein [Bacteroidia bacterium]
MKDIAAVIVSSLLSSALAAQNLVPNYSFEMYDTCPNTSSQIRYSQYWFQPNGPPTFTWQATSSSDYFNVCGTTGAGIPSNFAGFQFARTGNAYTGIAFSWFAPVPTAREYLEVGLISSLTNNKKYCGGYYVSRGEGFRNACDRQGMYFDTDSVFYFSPSYAPLIRNPQVENTVGNVVTDTVNWVLIKGAFIAQGGERFVLLGNFRDVPSTTTILISSGFAGAYYYIDDVFVEEMQVDTANAAGDKTICLGDSVTLGTPPCGGCLYQWQTDASLNDTTVAQPVATPTQTTTYILIMTDTSTGTICEWTSTDTVTVTVIPFAPQLADAGTEQTICKGQQATLGVAPCGGCTYLWQPFNNLNNATIAQPTAIPTQTTAYVLTMTDSVPPCAKTTTDTVTVTVNDCSEQPLEIYDIFTPNGDTKNETFYIKNLPANSSLQIFNRWGSKVYESSNYQNNWDGGTVPDGTYFYLLMLPGKETFHGFVEIRR